MRAGAPLRRPAAPCGAGEGFGETGLGTTPAFHARARPRGARRARLAPPRAARPPKTGTAAAPPRRAPPARARPPAPLAAPAARFPAPRGPAPARPALQPPTYFRHQERAAPAGPGAPRPRFRQNYQARARAAAAALAVSGLSGSASPCFGSTCARAPRVRRRWRGGAGPPRAGATAPFRRAPAGARRPPISPLRTPSQQHPAQDARSGAAAPRSHARLPRPQPAPGRRCNPPPSVATWPRLPAPARPLCARVHGRRWPGARPQAPPLAPPPPAARVAPPARVSCAHAGRAGARGPARPRAPARPPVVSLCSPLRAPDEGAHDVIDQTPFSPQLPAAGPFKTAPKGAIAAAPRPRPAGRRPRPESPGRAPRPRARRPRGSGARRVISTKPSAGDPRPPLTLAHRARPAACPQRRRAAARRGAGAARRPGHLCVFLRAAATGGADRRPAPRPPPPRRGRAAGRPGARVLSCVCCLSAAGAERGGFQPSFRSV